MDQDVVQDSEASEVDLVQTPDRNNTDRQDNARDPSQPVSVLSHRFRESSQKPSDGSARETSSVPLEDKIAVMVPPPSRPWEYQPFRGDTTVDTVLEEFETADGQVWYKIEFEDGRKQDVSHTVFCHATMFIFAGYTYSCFIHSDASRLLRVLEVALERDES